MTNAPPLDPLDPPASPAPPARPPCGLALAISLLAMLAVLKPLLVDTIDPDAFWHLRVANELLRHGIGPLVDQISFASIKSAWTPYSWLAELAMLGVWNFAGWRGAIVVQGLLTAAFVGLIALCCRELQRSRRLNHTGGFNTILATTAAVIWSLAYFSFRPAAMAIVLLTLGAWLILRDRQRLERSRAVWLCVPLAALLTNVHLTAVLLPVWLGCLAIGGAWEWLRSSENLSGECRRCFFRYLALTASTALACLATPMLPGMVHVMAHYQSQDVMVASTFIGEMQPFYQSAFGKVSAGLVLLTVAFAIVNRRRLRAGEVIWFAVMLVMLFRLGRFSPLMAIIAAPVMAASLPSFSDRPLRRRFVHIVLLVIVAISALRIATEFPLRTPMDAWLNRLPERAGGFPTAAADYVAEHVTLHTGRLVNEFNWGGYLAWRLGDRYQVLMDGRTQLYTSQFWLATCLGDEASRREFIRTMTADAAILPLHKSVFADALTTAGWTIAFQDGQAVVMIPPLDAVRRP